MEHFKIISYISHFVLGVVYELLVEKPEQEKVNIKSFQTHKVLSFF